MSRRALCDFYEEQMEDAHKTGVMFSLHVKATMMKVSHPIVFGHAVRIFYQQAFEKHGKLFDQLGVNVNNGLVNLFEKIETLPTTQRDEITRDLHACHEHRPELAMVDSAKGISNLHAPNDLIPTPCGGSARPGRPESKRLVQRLLNVLFCRRTMWVAHLHKVGRTPSASITPDWTPTPNH